MSKFTIARSAQADLLEIWNYIAENDETAANKLIRDLAKKFELLAENKNIGRRQDGFIVEMRMFPFKKYHLYYFTKDDGIEIYRVLHGSRDIETEFEDFFEGLKE